MTQQPSSTSPKPATGNVAYKDYSLAQLTAVQESRTQAALRQAEEYVNQHGLAAHVETLRSDPYLTAATKKLRAIGAEPVYRAGEALFNRKYPAAERTPEQHVLFEKIHVRAQMQHTALNMSIWSREDILAKAIRALGVTDAGAQNSLAQVVRQRLNADPLLASQPSREDAVKKRLLETEQGQTHLDTQNSKSYARLSDAIFAAMTDDFKGAQKFMGESIHEFDREFPAPPANDDPLKDIGQEYYKRALLPMKMHLLAAQSALQDYNNAPMPEVQPEQGQPLPLQNTPVLRLGAALRK